MVLLMYISDSQTLDKTMPIPELEEVVIIPDRD